MKTTNTKLLVGAILLLAITISISAFKSGDVPKKYTTMVVTKLGIKANLAITIVNETSKTEARELAGNYSYEGIISNAQAINETINKLASEGYRLVQIVPDQATVTYYLFEKN